MRSTVPSQLLSLEACFGQYREVLLRMLEISRQMLATCECDMQMM